MLSLLYAKCKPHVKAEHKDVHVEAFASSESVTGFDMNVSPCMPTTCFWHGTVTSGSDTTQSKYLYSHTACSAALELPHYIQPRSTTELDC